MTHKPKDAEVVEHEYDNLPGDHLNPLSHEIENSNSPKLNGHDLWREIREAVSEKDIVNLRENLQTIVAEKEKNFLDPGDLFHLIEKQDIDSLSDGLNQEMPDMNDIFEPLPRIHFHHHQRSNGETIHHFYKEQLKPSDELADEPSSFVTDQEWALVAEAIQEKDIMELRQKLQFIENSTSTYSFSTEEIEAYLEGSMLPGELQAFEDELALNLDLQVDIALNLELEEAVAEKDIMALRELMGSLFQRQNSTPHGVAEIDAFIEGESDSEAYAEFVEEMNESQGLRDEVNLIKEVNSALSESDIVNLRSNLQHLSHEIYQQETKSFLAVSPALRNLKKLGTVAAFLLVVFGFSLFFRLNDPSVKDIYDQVYDSPRALSAFRSASSHANDYLSEGIALYNQGDYPAALHSFGKTDREGAINPVAAFFSGASYQNLEQLGKAVTEYDKVILHKQNLFVEQAEWYRALSLLGSGDFDKAEGQLSSIVVRKGFYSRNARELLATLEKKKR